MSRNMKDSDLTVVDILSSEVADFVFPDPDKGLLGLLYGLIARCSHTTDRYSQISGMECIGDRKSSMARKQKLLRQRVKDKTYTPVQSSCYLRIRGIVP